MRSALVVILCTVVVSACSHGGTDLTKSQTQDSFGVQMARMNLWREAMFRFQRAVEISPGDAMAHNNLAVAYEANGEFEKAAREYREALKLDRSNQYIQKNYSRYTEFMARNRKRQQRQEAKAAQKSEPTTPATDAAASSPPSSAAAASTAAATTPPDPGTAPATSPATATAASTTTAPPSTTPLPATAPPATTTAPAAPPATSTAPPPSNPPPQTPPGGAR